MKSTLMVHRDEYMDVAQAVRRYKRLIFAGKFNRRTHFRGALVFEKHSTCGKWSGLCGCERLGDRL